VWNVIVPVEVEGRRGAVHLERRAGRRHRVPALVDEHLAGASSTWMANELCAYRASEVRFRMAVAKLGGTGSAAPAVTEWTTPSATPATRTPAAVAAAAVRRGWR
jgi:hypothetical protein